MNQMQGELTVVVSGRWVSSVGAHAKEVCGVQICPASQRRVDAWMCRLGGCGA